MSIPNRKMPIDGGGGGTGAPDGERSPPSSFAENLKVTTFVLVACLGAWCLVFGGHWDEDHNRALAPFRDRGALLAATPWVGAGDRPKALFCMQNNYSP